MKHFLQNLCKGDVRSWLSIIIVLASFTFLFCLLFITVPKDNEAIVNIATGAILVGGVGAVVSYYFGNSKQNENNNQPL